MADNYNPFTPAGDPPNIPPQLPTGVWNQNIFSNGGEMSYHPGSQNLYSQQPLATHPHSMALQPYLDLPGPEFAEFDEGGRPLLPHQPSSGRVRRRLGASGEHVKFRRTRSGCYTCRQRRVKCDETRPICERCSKGNRDCSYPEPSSSTKSRRGSTKTTALDADPASFSQDEEDDLVENEDSDIERTSEPGSASTPNFPESILKSGVSGTPSLITDDSPTPSTEGSLPPGQRPARQMNKSEQSHFSLVRRIAGLPKDIQFYLHYARFQLNPSHYGFKYDHCNFLRTTLIETAVRFEPLLYAVVGFAAYHHTISRPDGKLQDFLGYYNRSVSALRAHLARKREKDKNNSILVLLTMLQLAAIEEFLGDWFNCMVHQQAACHLLKETFTPHSILVNDTMITILFWYQRFDIFAGVMAGVGSKLGYEWFETAHLHYLQKAARKPNDLNAKYAAEYSNLRLMAAKIAIICGKAAAKEMPEEELRIQWEELSSEIRSKTFPRELLDLSKTLHTSSPVSSPKSPDALDSPYEPDILYIDELFPTNQLRVDLITMNLIFHEQLAPLFFGKQKTTEAPILARRVARIIEAVEHYPDSPQAVLLCYQSAIAICSVFMTDEIGSMWARRKLAGLECLGYLLPETLKAQLTAVWNTNVLDWWLPNDEGHPPILRSIRALISDRKEGPQTKLSEDIRDMRGLFSNIALSDGSSPDSAQSAANMVGSPNNLRRSMSGISYPPSKEETESSGTFGPPSSGSTDLDRAFFEASADFGGWQQGRRGTMASLDSFHGSAEND